MSGVLRRSVTSARLRDSAAVDAVVSNVIANVKRLDPTWLPSAPAALQPILARLPLRFTGRDDMNGVQEALELAGGQSELNEVILRLSAQDKESKKALRDAAASSRDAAAAAAAAGNTAVGTGTLGALGLRVAAWATGSLVKALQRWESAEAMEEEPESFLSLAFYKVRLSRRTLSACESPTCHLLGCASFACGRSRTAVGNPLGRGAGCSGFCARRG